MFVFKDLSNCISKKKEIPQFLNRHNDLEEAWEEINDYTIYDPGNEKHDFQNLARHELGDKILKQKDIILLVLILLIRLRQIQLINKWVQRRYWE